MHISPFLGHKPSSFRMNPIVRGFIVSETAFWSGYNVIAPIFAVYVADRISGGSIEAAGTAITVNLLSRVVLELMVARKLNRSDDGTKFVYALWGTALVAFSYFGFVWVTNFTEVLFLQIISGIGFAVASPAKYALFSEHLDKGKESSEWGIYDAITLGGMALTAGIGGYVAQEYGFNLLFVISGALVLVGAVPFIFFVFAHKKKDQRKGSQSIERKHAR